MRRVTIRAGGRDIHNHNTVYRHDASTRIVRFTAPHLLRWRKALAA